MINTTLFSERLKSLRLSKKLTQQELGELLNSTKSTISNFENSNRGPSLEFLISIADFFEVSTDYLIGRSDDPKVY